MKTWEELFTEPEKTDEEKMIVHCVEKIHADKKLAAYFAKQKVGDTYNELCKAALPKPQLRETEASAQDEQSEKIEQPEPEPKSKKKKKK